MARSKIRYDLARSQVSYEVTRSQISLPSGIVKFMVTQISRNPKSK